jgi:zinc protease
VQTYRKSLRENGYWLANLQSSLTEGTDPHELLDFEQRVAAITPADLKAAAQRYFNTGNYVQVVLYPEKKADAATVAVAAAPKAN